MKLRFKVIKRFLPQTLLGRSLLIVVIPVLLIQVVTTVIFFDRHWSKMTSRIAFAVAGEVSMITQLMENNLAERDISQIQNRALSDLNITVHFQEGAELDAQHQIKNPQVWDSYIAQSLLRELKMRLRRPFVLDIDFHEKWVRISVQIKQGVVTVSLPGSRLFSSSGYVFLLWVFGTSLLLLIIAVLFMRNQIRPIRKLAKAAEKFGRGHEIERFRPAGAKEIRQAARSFWSMHERIRSQINQRTIMLAGVSHDLRTPLTRMKLQLELMEQSEDVQAMRQDIHDMERMINAYLEFIKGGTREDFNHHSLPEIIQKVVAQTPLKTGQISFVQDDPLPEDVHAYALRALAFERALGNIVGNAVKYGDNAWVRLFADEDNIIIRVEDDGPGVPEEHYGDLFKPFFRMDKARSFEDGHMGLGLAIAQDIIAGHGGSIDLAPSNYGGLSVEIKLPKSGFSLS